MKTVVAIAALVLVLTGCSTPASDAPADPQDAPQTDQTAETAASACDALTAQELSGALGFDAGEGRSVAANITENEVSWTADRCTWETETHEVKLSIAGPTDFADGTITCAVVSAKGEAGVEVDDLGDTASFAFDDFTGSTAELRTCTDDVIIDISVETPDEWNATDAQEALTRLARLVLDRV